MGKVLICDARGCDAQFFLERSDRIGGSTVSEAVKEGWQYGTRDHTLRQVEPDLCPEHKP